MSQQLGEYSSKGERNQDVRINGKQNENEIPDDITLSKCFKGRKLNKTNFLNKKKNKFLDEDALKGIKEIYASDDDKIETSVIKSAEEILGNEAIYA
uniref:Uncharacterized protein n=1 Tax=Meloidogyne enterolobii TaxID=390850 RepID=A0A6V7XWV7_MELEN|nr:unnamed protein product [Meloidogyne enterolobii]